VALELETQIMREIGLGMHYNWYGGSGSCREIRLNAVEKLPNILKAYHALGLKLKDRYSHVDSPNKQLIDLLSRISLESDNDSYTLQNTWEAASYIIAAHIHNADSTNEQKAKAYENLRKQLEKIYLRKTTEDFPMESKYDSSCYDSSCGKRI